MHEADDRLAEQGIHLDLMRVRAFPFSEEVRAFIEGHDKVFVVEQNRDAQLRTLIVNELEINPAKLQRVLHYDGSPITAGMIAEMIEEHAATTVVPIRRSAP
jgi:2-oxoglutarate ferredoxin oxidoreductase subunit alpha